MRHRITGDGESDNGLGCCAMTWNLRTISGTTVTGTVDVPAPSLYVEDPYNDVDPSSLPVFRSDTIAATAAAGITLPTVSTVVGTTVTLTLNVLPTNEIGTAIVDSAGACFYVESSSSATSIVVDRDGMATGQILGFYPSTPRTITYGIHTEGFPIFDKFYEQGWANFQMLRGGRDYVYVTRAFDQAAASVVSQTVTYDADLTERLYDDLPYQSRVMVPTNQTRSIGLQVSIVLADPIAYWQLGAMAYTFRPTGDRTGRRA
jgi:hypothetical protein